MNQERVSGILLHPTSLPGPDGIGDLGPEAYHWLDFLHETGTQLWQVLPLGPTGYGDSPYQCFSAVAGNPYLVSPLLLLEEGLLHFSDISDRPSFPVETVDFGPAIIWKTTLLDRAFEHFYEEKPVDIVREFDEFRQKQSGWLDDFSLFMAIKEEQQGQPWNLWPKPLKTRDPEALASARSLLASKIVKHQFNQFLFYRQWLRLRGYAHSLGIRIIGDMPFVIAFDSADLWSEPSLFLMDADLNPTFVAGVPPDYFSADGQLWGNPLYKWEAHRAQGYQWWIKRLSAVLELVDIVRMDHFRGFAAAWHVPAGNTTARDGKWIESPGMELFQTFKAHFPEMPIIAEDLGVITDDVVRLRDGYNLPGMKILQFGFTGDPEDDFLPHHYPANCFAYTGSHDNNTALGWYHNATPREKAFCLRYLHSIEDEVVWSMLLAVWRSNAVNVVAPMQDLLGLGAYARMNLPGSQSGNWAWRMKPDALSDDVLYKLKELNYLYSRLSQEQKDENTRKLNEELEGTVKPH